MTVARAKISVASSPSAVKGLTDTEFPLSEQLLKSTPGGRSRHGHNLNIHSSWSRVHSNMPSCYNQLLNYLSNGRQGHRQNNTSNLLECTCTWNMDSHKGKLTLAVIKITLSILELWVISAVLPLCKGVYRSLMKGRSTCDVYL